MRVTRILGGLLAALAIAAPAGAAGLPAGTYEWPVEGTVIRAFEQPSSPYAAGHRGIDIATPYGTPIGAPAPGTVSFAGKVAGSLFVSVDHAGGIRTTYSWLSGATVAKGDAVETGDVLGYTGSGHAGVTPDHLHFGVRLDGDYIDPMMLLRVVDVVGLIRLAPLRGP